MVVSEILNASSRFVASNEDEADFQDLLALYSTNVNILREFAVLTINNYLFPLSAGLLTPDRESHSGVDRLTRSEFLCKLAECDYLFLKPNELRKRFTEYVMMNKARAMLPSRTIMRYSTNSLYAAADGLRKKRGEKKKEVKNSVRDGPNEERKEDTLQGGIGGESNRKK